MMAKTFPEWAQIGAEMVFILHNFGGSRESYGKVVTIASRLGNGNLRLSDHNGQWRPSGDGIAYLAGTDGWDRVAAKLVTPQIRASIDLDRQYRAALRKIDDEAKRLQQLSRNGSKEDVIAAAALIAEPANA